MNSPPCGTQWIPRTAVAAALVLLSVCGTAAADCLVKAELLPPPAARVGDWIDIVFTYICVNRVTYNAVGDPVTRTDPLGNVWTFDWDGGQSLAGITSPLGNRISITYDAKGQPVSLTGPNGDRSELAYDVFGNLLTTKDPLGAVNRFGYDPSGLRLTSFTDPKGNVVAYTHDANDRLLRFVHSDGTYREFGHGCCAGTTIRNEPGAIITQVRDTLLRRSQVVDALGNRSSFAYDGNGNQVSATDAVGSVWSRQFDAANRLTRLTDPLGAAVEFLYDSLGRVVRFTDAGGRSTEFTYDEVGRLTSEKLPSGVVRTLKRDPAGRIQKITNGHGQKTLFQHDAEGRLVSKSRGSVNLARFEYDPGGNLAQEVSAWGTTRYRYDGANGVIDAGDGLYLMRHRAYHADLQRFLQRDPAGLAAGPGEYLYAGGDPGAVHRPVWPRRVPRRLPAADLRHPGVQFPGAEVHYPRG